MTTELSTQINPEEFGLTTELATELTKNLPQILSEREPLISQYDEVLKMDIEDPATAVRAAEVRKLVKNNRTKGIEPWHKSSKDYFLKGGQFVDAIKRKEVQVNERMEENLEQIEKNAENKEKQRIAQLQLDRVEMIKEYVADAHLLELGKMESDVFEPYLASKKLAYQTKQEEEKQAALARIAKEKEEAQERERIRAEHEAQQKLIKEQQAQMLAEKAKADAEKKKLEDAAQKEREIAAAKLKEEQDKAAKLQAELKAKADAEAKAIADQKAKELAEEKQRKFDEAKAAKAPIKQQLNKWIDGFSLGKPISENETTTEIEVKFEAFRVWAKSQVEKL